MPVWVGTSGWQYRDWRGAFYPQQLPARAWLSEYARHFATVEVNNSFYRLPSRETFAAWAAAVPDGFRFVVKASRFLTHLKRLRDPAEPVARLVSAAEGLGERLSAILLQLPPTMPAEPGRLADTLARFPAEIRVAVEARHPSWFDEPVYAVLRDAGAALVLADRRNRRSSLVRTADWCYLRLHEGTAAPPPCYGRGALTWWAARLAEMYGRDADGYVFFNNDGRACAPRNALAFRALLARQETAVC